MSGVKQIYKAYLKALEKALPSAKGKEKKLAKVEIKRVKNWLKERFNEG